MSVVKNEEYGFEYELNYDESTNMWKAKSLDMKNVSATGKTIPEVTAKIEWAIEDRIKTRTILGH